MIVAKPGYFDIALPEFFSILATSYHPISQLLMKFGHLLFPAFFFFILICGAILIMRTVETRSAVALNETVYLESAQRRMEVTAESVGSTREKAHEAFIRFADALVEKDVLSLEEKDNLDQILKLGEGHWGEENWAPAFYAFERVLNELSPLIDEGLGYKKAHDMESLYRDVSHSITNEIALVESSYLKAIETANLGYNAIQERDWISAVQLFSKAVGSINLAKAQAVEIVGRKLQEAYAALETGDLATSTELFSEILAVYPHKQEAIKGLQLLQEEVGETMEPPLYNETDIVEEISEKAEVTDVLGSPPAEAALEEIAAEVYPVVARADWHFERRELKDSLSLYLEASAKNPEISGLTERIDRTRKALQNEELIRLMEKASILMELGQWDGAVKTYRHVLNVDPVHRESRRGWEDALVKLVDQVKIDQYKELIHHHLSARRYSHAKDILAEFKTVFIDHPERESLLLPLERDLEEQQIPVKLKLLSDGETWITIPGKMAPERFKEKEMTLFPGRLRILGWKGGFEHRTVSLAFGSLDAPPTVKVICDTKLDTPVQYGKLSGPALVLAALKRFDLAELLTDRNGFAAWFLMGDAKSGPLGNGRQINDWDSALFSTLYAALSQQADQEYNLIHLDARAQYIQVPRSMTRKETIELGQYLMTRLD